MDVQINTVLLLFISESVKIIIQQGLFLYGFSGDSFEVRRSLRVKERKCTDWKQQKEL